MPGWLKVLLLVLAGLLLIFLFSGEIRDADIFWHLRTGQYIVQNHCLPVPDPFSYTGTGTSYSGEDMTRRFNLTHEWLSQVIMYLIFAGGGFPALVIARVALLLLFCGLVGWIAFRRTQDFSSSLAAALAASGMSFYFAQSRPFLATFALLAITMLVLESRRGLWLLPPIFLVWANCHSGFVVGWLMCAAYCVDALILRLRKEESPAAVRMWRVSAICVLVSGLNPNGFRVLQVLWFYRVSGIQTTNLEWQRPIFWTPGIYSFLLFGALLILFVARRKTRPLDWLLCIVFGAISLLAVRNTIFVGLTGPVVIATYLPKRRFVAPSLLALGAVGLLAYDIAPAVASDNTLALRVATWQLPTGAADFIAAHHITARMFNNYEDGGYLIWRLYPSQRDFIDGRGLSEKAFADYRRILYDSSGGKTAEDLLDQYGIEMIVIGGFDYLSGQVYPVAVDLAKPSRAEWKLAYADNKSLIFLRHAPAGIRPLSSQTALLDSLSAQCTEHVRHDPLRPRCAFGLGELYAFHGDPEHARQWLKFYRQHRTSADPEADDIYQSLTVTDLNKQATALQAKGNLQESETLLRRALATAERTLGPEHPDTAGALNNLATVLEAKHEYPEAESLLRRSLAICEKKFGPSDPHTSMALDNLAGVLEATGDLINAEACLRRALSAAEQSLGAADPATRAIRGDLDALLQARRSEQHGK